MNRMSDDLISRKAVLHILYDIKDDDNVPKNYGTVLDIIRKIRKLPTAFDKEKVIEELRNPDNYTIVAGKHFTTVDRSVEIVEKGGIE